MHCFYSRSRRRCTHHICTNLVKLNLGPLSETAILNNRHQQYSLFFLNYCNSTAMCDASLAIWIETPFNVLALKDPTIFGYSEKEIVGQTVLKFSGPETNLKIFQAAIANTAELGTSIMQLILYDRNGKSCRSMASFRPLLYNGVLVGCLLTLRPSYALSLQQVFKEVRESNHPHCLVSATSTNSIHMADEGFLTKLGCSRADVLGKDLIQLSNSAAKLSSMLTLAGNGDIGRGRIEFQLGSKSFAEQSAACVPVVEAANGTIRHILLLLLPAPTNCDESDQRGPQPCAVGLDDLLQPLPKVAPGGATASPSAAGDSPARCSGANIVIRPHSRPHGTAPVVLTEALLAPLRRLSLLRAAAALGVSATAFKHACRRLGLKRWSYRRGREKDARPAPAESAGDSGGADTA